MLINETSLALVISLLASSAMADTVRVPVINKQPIYSNTTVQSGSITQCREVYVQQQQGGVFDGTSQALKGDGNALFGSILGGVVGSQFGGGQGKTAMTVLGVIVGGNMANGTSNNQGGSTRQKVCDEVPQYVTKTNVAGWNVSYNFENQMYHTQMKRDPGSYITLETNTTHRVK